MIIRSVENTIARYALIPRGSRVLVGVSGGPDSLALLCALHALRRGLRIGPGRCASGSRNARRLRRKRLAQFSVRAFAQNVGGAGDCSQG